MKCPRCQQENPLQAKFCLECATPLALRCANCETQLPAGAKFCFECAHPVGSAGAAPRFAAPESYTPKHLAEKILTSKAALEGERKHVTVLFADLKGSMELLADRDPEEARKILDPVLEHMMEAVHRYEGTVNQVMGDGIMALFGAPVAHEDHAVRACYAALRMQDNITRYAHDVRRFGGTVVKIRVGLNSGEVVVRAIRSDLRMDYTAIGETTHLAARMEQLAEPGTILLTPATRQLVENYVDVTARGAAAVKGLAEPVELYELVGPGSVGSRLQAAAARGLTRFVGRGAEIEQLQEALVQAGAGRGQVATVVGDAGVGKSRLYWEFVHSDRTEGWRILEGRAVSYGKATSYLPVVGLLKGCSQIEPRDETQQMREKLISKVLSLGEALRPTLPALLALLDLPVEDPAWAALDASQRRRKTIDAVKRILLRESQVQRLIIICEDLHWIDSETQAVLDSLVDSLPTARLLLLVNYRPEYQHPWGSKTYYRQIRIDPMTVRIAQELLDSLLGHDPKFQPLRRLLIQRTEGNPFFLEESVRTLVETKILVGERGRYQLSGMPEALQTPATAQAIIAARIDRLEPEDKQLLQTAAVIGKDIPYALLEAVADEPEYQLRNALERLRTAEFLYEARMFPDLEYTFKHALTHEVAYGSLLQERRCVVHARILDAIERLFSDRLAEHVEILGDHAIRGEQWEKAVAYLHQAGTKAAGRSANREAVQWLEKAMTALTHVSETRTTIEKAIDLRIDLRNSLLPLGELVRALGSLAEAEVLADKVDDAQRSSALSVMKATARFAQGDFQGAVESAQRGQTIAASIGDLLLATAANDNLAFAYFGLGDYRAAVAVLQKNIAWLHGERMREHFRFGTIPPGLVSCWTLAACHSELGNFDDAIAHGEEGVRIAEMINQPGPLASANWGVGYLHCRKGEFERAIQALERTVALCREWNLLFWYRLTSPIVGYAYAVSGRAAEAMPFLDQDTTVAAGEGLGTLFGAWVGHGCLLVGRTDEAMRLAQRTLDLARAHRGRGYEADALYLHGEILSRHQSHEAKKSEASYRLALTLATELGMRPLVAHCHLGLGKLYRRTGKREQAQEHLATATTMYREMGMTYWLEKAEAEMRELG
jgi:class 3 adenylate cyclase/tetratricopeptide (TPR) repeat protein